MMCGVSTVRRGVIRMNRHRARRIRNLTRFWSAHSRRKQPRTRVRYCVYCPVLLPK